MKVMSSPGKEKVQISNENVGMEKSTNFIVSEGSIVIFDLHDFISENDINSRHVRFGSYRQIGGTPNVDLIREIDTIVSFKAPYVKGNNANTKLNFELTTTDNNDRTFTYKVNVIVKRVHRAIIFQGGVSLGAYEAGVFSALVEKLSKEDESKKRSFENERRSLFDVVCGAFYWCNE